MIRRALSVFAIGSITVCGFGVAASCGSSGAKGGGGDAGSDATTGDSGAHPDGPGGDGPTGDAPIVEGGLPGDGGVFHGDGGCFTLGSACGANGDCCSNDCSDHVCSYPPCTSDNQACSSNGQCCGQDCGDGGTCVPLNPTCGTLGNACGGTTIDGGPEPPCCSGHCVGGACQPPSFCGQVGEACATGADCCSGTCNVSAGQQLGLCGAPPTGPASACQPDGVLCAGTTADGGIIVGDGGIPACGGDCCSRACAPWGPTGVLVCQPASGCRIEGDICTSSAECCGGAGSGTPGDGLVTCVISAGATVGICRSPTGGSDAGNACIPNGDVCKLASSSCNKDCNCCAGNCETQDTCKQDNEGIPRCALPQCSDAGATCASSADCCNGNPCVPAAGGTLSCYPYQCVPSCGTCTNSADCCPGFDCLNGQCDPCGGGSPSDGGILGDASGLPPDGGPPPLPDGGCAAFGQLCSSNADCCNAVPCTNGRCQYPVQ
ncbi:MAG: hypothetical protein ACRELB_12925 [Polyangiaceae bacterium]